MSDEPHCIAPDCAREAISNGLCEMHRARMRRLGQFDLPSFEERFWDRVNKSGGPKACWPWTGSRLKSTHGRVYREGRLWVASRVAWELTKGPIPEGMDVCHTCDFGACCNPSHLFLGTHTDNMQDKEVKRRGNHACGERQSLAKLTTDAVRKIRKMAGRKPNAAIAKDFGVTEATISKVIRRDTWAHVE